MNETKNVRLEKLKKRKWCQNIKSDNSNAFYFGKTLLFTPDIALVQGVQINNMDQKDNHSSCIDY